VSVYCALPMKCRRYQLSYLVNFNVIIPYAGSQKVCYSPYKSSQMSDNLQPVRTSLIFGCPKVGPRLSRKEDNWHRMPGEYKVPRNANDRNGCGAPATVVRVTVFYNVVEGEKALLQNMPRSLGNANGKCLP